MEQQSRTQTHGVIKKYESELLGDWLEGMNGLATDSRISETELRSQAREFLELLQEAIRHGKPGHIEGPEWMKLREFLDQMSLSRVAQGFNLAETATFIFSFKKPLFARLQKEFGKDPEALAAEMWVATELLDKLGLHTVKAFQRTREDVIARQQTEMLELSTPVVKLWDGVLALPMIGTLDSNRTQIVMESLLQRIVDTGSELAIIDITGVPMVDTLVAQHLLKTVTAIRLMGADCIISGIRPQIAQTIVHLGVDLQGVITKATLADALSLALKKTGFTITKAKV
ncbi:MAG TPA: STAS domain-containing protein [Pirellulales bacterium]|jgi:rsbT co-antagonist protein RsbR|nr:STAS domain-containing protein [Pirellulales bacterium]